MLRVRLDTRDFWLGENWLRLPKRETQVLMLLVKYAGFTTPQDRLLEIWDCEPDDYISDRCLQVTMTRLRKVLGQGAIVNRLGVGYKLLLPVDVEDGSAAMSS